MSFNDDDQRYYKEKLEMEEGFGSTAFVYDGDYEKAYRDAQARRGEEEEEEGFGFRGGSYRLHPIFGYIALPFGLALVLLIFSFTVTGIADFFEDFTWYLIIPNLILMMIGSVLVVNLYSQERLFKKKFPDPGQVNFYKRKRNLYTGILLFVGLCSFHPILDPTLSRYFEQFYEAHRNNWDEGFFIGFFWTILVSLANLLRIVIPLLIYPVIQFVLIKLLRRQITSVRVQKFINKKIMKFTR